MSEKPIGIVLPTWNPNEPRFVVAEATEHLNDDRKFVNGKCVENQRLGIVYSVEDIVDALNVEGDEIDRLENENEQLRRRLEKINGGYGLLTHRNGKTANEWLIEQLESENEQLRQELNDCEKFRHSVFKRMNELTDQLKEKEEDEKLYAQEIVELNKTKKELIEFNELGGDY